VTAPHDRPTKEELLESLREWLETDVIPATEGRLRFHALVAAKIVAMVERELVLGPDQEAAHAARLADLGVASEAELAEAIRDGRLDDRYDEVKASVWMTVREKLSVANPGYLDT